MFTFFTTFFQHPGSLMLITVFIMILIGVVLQRIIRSWQQSPLTDDTDFEEFLWKEL